MHPTEQASLTTSATDRNVDLLSPSSSGVINNDEIGAVDTYSRIRGSTDNFELCANDVTVISNSSIHGSLLSKDLVSNMHVYAEYCVQYIAINCSSYIHNSFLSIINLLVGNTYFSYILF